MSKYFKIIKLTNCYIKYLLCFYLDKYIFITTWKFKFKFIVFGVLALRLLTCPFFSSYQAAASSAPRGLPNTQVVSLGHLSKLHNTHHQQLPLRLRGVHTADGPMREEAHTSPGSRSRTVGTRVLEHQVVSGKKSGIWVGWDQWRSKWDHLKVQGRGHLLAQV